jgi:hypothetical protein
LQNRARIQKARLVKNQEKQSNIPLEETYSHVGCSRTILEMNVDQQLGSSKPKKTGVI